MSVFKWAYTDIICDGIVCLGDCDHCSVRDAAEAFKTLKTDFKDCRNELCLKCGSYQYDYKTHECDGCRWRH